MLRGSGVKINNIKGFETLGSAASSGSLSVQYESGRCFQYAQGTKKDDVRAVEHYKTASEGGHVGALFRYGRRRILEEDRKESFQWYSEDARKNHRYAIERVGECLIRVIGVEKNVSKGVKSLMYAVAAGRTAPLYMPARYYRFGIGLPLNKKKAIAFYRRYAAKNPSTKLEKCTWVTKVFA